MILSSFAQPFIFFHNMVHVYGMYYGFTICQMLCGCLNYQYHIGMHCITFRAANADCSALRRSEVPRNLSCPTPVRKSFRTSESFSSQPNTLQSIGNDSMLVR